LERLSAAAGLFLAAYLNKMVNFLPEHFSTVRTAARALKSTTLTLVIPLHSYKTWIVLETYCIIGTGSEIIFCMRLGPTY
jgi:hypothetical protein